MNRIDKMYHSLGDRILSQGVDVKNDRTGVVCRTVLNEQFKYLPNEVPMITTKKVFWKGAIAEMIGYLQGCDNASQFRKLGTKTWDANTNLNKSWIENPHRKGEGDLGRAYGVVGKDFGGINLFEKVYDNLRNGVDDRGEIITFWKPDEFDKACLRPCMYSHHFSLLGGKLYLHSTQRSCDYALGVPYNMIQVYFFWKLMAQVTGHEMGEAVHTMINIHLYENQIPNFEIQSQRTSKTENPITSMWINPEIKTWEDIQRMTLEDVNILDYTSHEIIKYPFTE